jgi:prepilin-type N-terminal cleavage/methylation domain-containing protein/prepilin-type processing-associated H-X9-DG protein
MVASRRKVITHSRFAFTLVELLVSLAIVGVLVGLIAPAILYARESSRRVACSNHLRQLVLACQSYHDLWNVFPPWSGQPIAGVARLFPLLEQPPVDTLNVVGWEIPVLLCPSDGWGSDHASGCSYLMSGGPSLPNLHDWNGLANHRMVRVQDFTDGTSQTAGWSERLRQQAGSSSIRRLSFRVSPSTYSEQEAARLCSDGPRTLNPNVGSDPDPSFRWQAVSLVAYSHLLKPNGPYCQGANGELIKFRTASSEHAGGVFVAFVDGHVSFIANDIDGQNWFSMGTPAGGETSQ